MSLEDDLKLAVSSNDYSTANKLMNALRLKVLRASQAPEWDELWNLEQAITDALVPYRDVIRDRTINTSFLAGQLYSLQGLVRGLRESRAPSEDIEAARKSPEGLRILMALHKHGPLMAHELRRILRCDSESLLSQRGAKLVEARLIRRDHFGKQACYRLTASGSIVARQIADELRLRHSGEFANQAVRHEAPSEKSLAALTPSEEFVQQEPQKTVADVINRIQSRYRDQLGERQRGTNRSENAPLLTK